MCAATELNGAVVSPYDVCPTAQGLEKVYHIPQCSSALLPLPGVVRIASRRIPCGSSSLQRRGAARPVLLGRLQHVHEGSLHGGMHTLKILSEAEMAKNAA